MDLGDIVQAQVYATQGVELADRSQDAFQRIARRTDLAHALYQAGRQVEAEVAFREAEAMQEEIQPAYSLLYSLRGSQYWTQPHIPHGLLARTELHRVQGGFAQARRDLEEAMTIPTRGEMGLHQADSHLEYARLHLALGDKTMARESLVTAKTMVDRMGYHRRDAEVQEMEEQPKRP